MEEYCTGTYRRIRLFCALVMKFFQKKSASRDRLTSTLLLP